MRTGRGHGEKVPREVTVTFIGRLPITVWVQVPDVAPYTDRAGAIEKAGKLKKADGWMTPSALEHYRQHPTDALVEWGRRPAVVQLKMSFEYAS